MTVPVVDIAKLVQRDDPQGAAEVAAALGQACREHGFFYVVGHGVSEALQAQLLAACQAFFALPLASKLALHMRHGGPAWRGYFPVGEELTSGRPDQKEGIYFGSELAEDHPRVRAGLPLFGRNQFPADLPQLRPLVLDYMAALTQLGHQLMAGLSLSLGLPASYFQQHYTADPTLLFRVFHYPPSPSRQPPSPGEAAAELWGVGEHTDYGVLTILKQDEVGGLWIKRDGSWLAAPPIANSFVCNIGDMLERMTHGRYRSTPHRVRNVADRGRLSLPFFFDPGWDSTVQAIPESLLPPAPLPPGSPERWDGGDVHAYRGTYGDYLLAKVKKVFPQLLPQVKDAPRPAR